MCIQFIRDQLLAILSDIFHLISFKNSSLRNACATAPLQPLPQSFTRQEMNYFLYVFGSMVCFFVLKTSKYILYLKHEGTMFSNSFHKKLFISLIRLDKFDQLNHISKRLAFNAESKDLGFRFTLQFVFTCVKNLYADTMPHSLIAKLSSTTVQYWYSWLQN